MRAMVLEGGAGLDHLKLAERPDPTPGPGEVLVRLSAASINYRDLATVTMMAPQRPLIPLSDGAGVVEAVGAGVTRVGVGDLVTPGFFPHWTSGRLTPQRLAALGGVLDGVACEAIALTAEGVTKAPAGWTAAEAATLPCAAVTAWRGLIVEGKLRAGETVLVQGTGGVSIFALQFAKLAGARVIVTSSSDEKLERAKGLGADATINYRTTPDWAKAARELTGGRGVDHVVEVGGAGTFQQSIAACALGGSIAVIGVLSGFVKDLNVAAMFGANLHINGITVGSREHAEDMVAAIEGGGLKPVIDRHYRLEQLPEALALMQSGGHFGKVVIDI
jgi:NADPH:quinone reductase-like Zn-dependent oxidoreductase